MTQIAVSHGGVADHAGSLCAVSFLGNQSVSQSVLRPGNNLVALDHAIVETHLLEIRFYSSGSDGHRIGRHHQAHRARLHLVSDVGSGLAQNWTNRAPSRR